MYLFDVDGTLTPPRNPMVKKFRDKFIKWCKGKTVYLVSGSDFVKIKEQVGDIVNLVDGVYADSGNSLWVKSKLIKYNRWDKAYEVIIYCRKLLKKSKYPIKTGVHYELRNGMVNFSVVGRNCNQQQRKDYYNWDSISKERKKICKKIRREFPEVDVVIGGQISVDIYPKGWDKSQVLKDLQSITLFFGDKTYRGGNDYCIAKRLKKRAIQVEGWIDLGKKLDFW